MISVQPKILQLIGEELGAAVAAHGQYASMHEAYAVIREEIEETAEELERVKGIHGEMWACIRRDDHEAARAEAAEIYRVAALMAGEAIRVAATALKVVTKTEGAKRHEQGNSDRQYRA